MIKKANCMFCHCNYGMLVEVEDGKVFKVKPNLDHPVSRGTIY